MSSSVTAISPAALPIDLNRDIAIGARDIRPEVQSAARRLDYIDALRGFACLWVILCHVHGYWLDNFRPHGLSATTLVTRIAGYGGKGVDLFIVLSGFCLYWPLVSKGRETRPFDLRKFFSRRARRILPAYYAALAVCTALVLVPILQPYLVGRPITATDFVSHLFLVQTFSAATTPAINGSFWSLALEMQLYLAFPLLLMIGRRWGLRGIIVFGVAAATVYQGVAWYVEHALHDGVTAGVMSRHLPARWLEFISGMVAATLVSRPAANHVRWAAILAVVLLPIGIIDQPLGMPGGAFSHALWGAIFAAAIVVLAKVSPPVFVNPARLGLLTRIGVVSYSLYLVQQPFLLLTAPLVKSLQLSALGNYAVAGAIGVPAMCGIAYAFYRAFERPFLRQH
jgi:peptidoglycan/LPS O-acetylase OafA/YrhL